MGTTMSTGTRRTVAVVVLVGLLLSGLLAGVVSYYASSSPDGLEKVAEDQGFIETAQDSAVADSPLADYGVAGVEDERLAVGLAGVVGVVITLVVAFGLFWLLARRRTAAPDPAVAAAAADPTDSPSTPGR